MEGISKDRLVNLRFGFEYKADSNLLLMARVGESIGFGWRPKFGSLAYPLISKHLEKKKLRIIG